MLSAVGSSTVLPKQRSVFSDYQLRIIWADLGDRAQGWAGGDVSWSPTY